MKPRPMRFLVPAVFVGASLIMVSPSSAQRRAEPAEGGFAPLAGSWSGAGTITTKTGQERIRCRVTYSVAPSGAGMRQDLRCASDSYNFQVASDIQNQGGGRLAGTWTEVTRNASGSVSGQMSGGSIQVAVTGPGFTAGLSISTRGNSQSVDIRPNGTDIVDVSVNLKRN